MVKGLPKSLQLPADDRRRIVAVAGGSEPADLVLRGGRVVNLFTEQLQQADIGIAAGRIAWVGSDPGGGATVDEDVSDSYLVPGFIEPHAHLDLMYRPEQALHWLARHGTTCVCGDPVFFMANLDDESFLTLAQELASGPVHLVWNFRPWVDGLSALELERFSHERVADLFHRLPGVMATGELSCWPALVEGDDRIGWVIETAVNQGLRVDGHAPGASRQRLGQLLAAGITACHEAIRGKELITRISSGYWTEIRHSDLRPDGPELARALVDSGLPTDRVLLTTDGPEAESLAAGHLDRVIEIVVAAGVDPIPAIKMATLNVATYLGLDAHLGAMAPGRCADILAVRTLDRPSPERMWIAGQSPPAEPSTIEWAHLTANPISLAPLREDDLASFSTGTPGIALEGVVTRAVSNPGEPLPADWVRAYLVNRGGQTITGAPLHGAGSIDGFASSATGYGHVLVVGTDPGAMLDAYRRVVALGGGTVCAGGPELPLPILGTMTDDSFAALLTARSLLRRALGQRGFNVCSLDYFSLFLSLGVIPEIKLIDRGVLDVKRRRILIPARSLAR